MLGLMPSGVSLPLSIRWQEMSFLGGLLVYFSLRSW